MREIVIISAIELTLAQKTRLEEGIRAQETEELKFRYLVEESRIGGIAVLNGERILDRTASRQLYGIRKTAENLVTKRLDAGISVAEIPALLEARADALAANDINFEECGTVIRAADGVVQIKGLSACRNGELILIGERGYALAMNLEKDSIGAILLSEEESVEFGDIAYTTGSILEIPVGNALLGRVVDPLGNAVDGHAPIKHDSTRPIEGDAPRIIDRAKVNEPLYTGILAIDAMVPIGKGQRELIIGDRQTGKTSVAVDTILNQRGKNVLCVYVAIGQRASAVSKLVKTLDDNGAMAYTTVVLASASDTAPMQYLAPYAGAAIAEHFMRAGRDVLIVYDDLSKHAVAYRTISLLLKRPAGREAYPGDIFYLHSKLLERAAKLSPALGGGSMTALPIIETLGGDISAYIPTNVISITDGQIYLEGELFHAGQRPAINVGLSVSRVGGAAQSQGMRKLSAALRLDIAHYRELAVFAQFGSSLEAETKDILEYGAKIMEAIRQPEENPLAPLREEVYLFAVVKRYLRTVPLKKVGEYLNELYVHLLTTQTARMKRMRETETMTAEDMEALHAAAKECAAYYAEEA